VKRLFSENVDLAQMAKTKMIFGKKKSRFGEKKAFLVIKKIGVCLSVPKKIRNTLIFHVPPNLSLFSLSSVLFIL
jgi:hypothetical protein